MDLVNQTIIKLIRDCQYPDKEENKEDNEMMGLFSSNLISSPLPQLKVSYLKSLGPS